MKKILMVLVMMVIGCVNVFAQDDYEKMSIEKLKQFASKGDVEAQLELSDRYEDEENYVESYRYARMAADQGSSDGCFFVGLSYFYGDGVEQNYEEAVKWYKKAAELDESDAMTCSVLGECYYGGFGVAKDLTQAKYWYTKGKMLIIDSGYMESPSQVERDIWRKSYDKICKALEVIDNELISNNVNSYSNQGRDITYTAENQIPTNFKLQDNIVVLNSTPYNIDKIRVSYNGSEVAVYQSIMSGEEKTIRQFDDNYLARFRGEKLYIEMDSKSASQANENIWFKFSEHHHDLVIEVLAGNGNNVANNNHKKWNPVTGFIPINRDKETKPKKERSGRFWNGMLKGLEATSTVLEGTSKALNDYNNSVNKNTSNDVSSTQNESETISTSSNKSSSQSSGPIYKDVPCDRCGGTGECAFLGAVGSSFYCHGSGKCGHCYGKGHSANGVWHSDDKGEKCNYCHGSGKCKYCNGSGKCSKCNGKKKITKKF